MAKISNTIIATKAKEYYEITLNAQLNQERPFTDSEVIEFHRKVKSDSIKQVRILFL